MIRDQPPPIPGTRRIAWEIVVQHVETLRGTDAYTRTGILDLVLADMRERDLVGRERYGMPLTSGNGRDHLVDAYQEQLDGVAYLAAWLDERGYDLLRSKDEEWLIFVVETMFQEQVKATIKLRAIMQELAR